MKKLVLIGTSIVLALLLSAGMSLATQMISFFPTGTAVENQKFKAVFPSKMVEDNQIGKLVAPEEFPFKVEPAIIADGTWENSTTFTASLIVPLPKATVFTVTFKNGETFKFNTEPLKLISAVQADYSDESGIPEARIKLEFNMPVSPQRLSGFLSLTTSAKKKLQFSLQGALPSKTIYLDVKLKGINDGKVILSIANGLTGSVGTLGLAKSVQMNIPVDPILAVNEATAGESAGKITIRMNQPVNLTNANPFIGISPKLPFRLERSWDENSFFIYGDFKPRQRYELTIKKGIPSLDGKAKLAGDFVKAFIFPDIYPSISFPSPGIYLSPNVSTTIPIETINVNEVDISLWKLYESNIPYVMRNDGYWYNFPLDLSARVAKKRAKVNGAPNEKVRRAIDIKSLFEDETSSDNRGIYLLSVNRVNSEEWNQENQIISLTDIGVSVKLWPGGCLVWANSIATAKPIDNALVRIYNSASQLIAEGRTDSQGLCRYFPENLDTKPLIVTVTKNDDISFVTLQNALINNETFDISGRQWITNGYDGMMFTPRGVYRPGENVIVNAIVRELGNKTPEPFPVLFVIYDSMGRAVKRGSALLSPQGCANIEYEIPNSASSGQYVAALYVPGNEEKAFASVRFNVESFAPPRIEVALSRIDSKSDVITRGESPIFNISSKYLFGVPSSNMMYEVSYLVTNSDFTPNDEKLRAFKFGDPEKKGETRKVSVEEGLLDIDGEASVKLSINNDFDPPAIMNLTITASVLEDSGRWVAKDVSYKYFTNDYIMGIMSPESATINQPLEIMAAALSSDGKPAEKLTAKATLFKAVYHYNIVQIDGMMRWQTTEELNKVDEKQFSIENGLAKISFDGSLIKDWGEYLVKIEASDNPRISASSRLWANSYESSGGSRLMDRVELEFDKTTYKTGETATVRVKAPFPGTLLFSVENSKLIGQQVIEMKDVEVDVYVPLSSDMTMGSGNLWCTAAVLRPVKADEPWATHRAIGVKALIIDNEESKIPVEVNAPDKILPGSKMSVKVQSVPGAEVAIALVDEGILQITGYTAPDPFGYFYAKRNMSSNLFDIYDQLMQTEPGSTQLLHPSGGMAAKAAAFMGNLDSRRFKLLSMFKPKLEADNSGYTVAEFEIPEFSGRVRLFAVAVSGSRFGSAAKSVQIGRDIVIEPNLPRFAAIGDTFKSPLSVFNTSGEQQKVKLALSSDNGLELLASRDISIELAPKSSAAFETAFKATSAGTARYTVNEQELLLPIRGIYPTITRIGGGSFGAGETAIDAKDVSNATLTISGTPIADLAPAISYMMRYPYGCLEQTVSKAWVALEFTVQEKDRMLSTAIARIQSMQLYDGSFSAWPGSSESYPWGSVYVAHFLSELRKASLPAEITFPEDAFKGVMNYLRQLLAEIPNEDSMEEDLTSKAYASFVLALEKETPLGWMYWLRENSQNLLPSGRIWLEGAYALAEGKSAPLKSLGIAGAIENPTTLDSTIRNTAQQLLIWTVIQPDSNEAADLARRLMEWGKASRWYGTQENALCAIALSRFTKATYEAKTALKCTITDSSGKEIKAFDLSGGQEKISGISLPVKIKAEGTGTAYFNWETLGEPPSAPKPESRGLSVESVWLDKNGKVLSGDIKLGSQVFVSLKIVPKIPASNIVLSMLLPAGLEIESLTSQNIPGLRTEARDDRLLLFINSLEDSIEYKYVLRAVTPGNFALPPITSEGMYSPAYRFIGKGSRINIVK